MNNESFNGMSFQGCCTTSSGGFASISPETLLLAHHFCAAHICIDGRLRPWHLGLSKMMDGFVEKPQVGHALKKK